MRPALRYILFGGRYGSGTPAGVYLGSESRGLAIDFAQNSALVRGHTSNFLGTPQALLTVARASSATYFDSAGIMQTAGNNVLRLDHNPSTLAALGVLVEEQRTNLLLRSSEFDNASWNTSAEITVSSNQTGAPDGTTTMDKLVEASGTSTHKRNQGVAGLSGDVTYTFTCFAKKAERDHILLWATGTSRRAMVRFDLTNGTVEDFRETNGTITAKTIENIGNGVYRCRMSFTFPTNAPSQFAVTVDDGVSSLTDSGVSYSGNGASGIYVWGAQLEAGAFATSYIPTTSAQVTRAADAIRLATSAFPYSQSTQTVVFEGDWQVNDAGASFFGQVDDGTNSERFLLYANNTARSCQITGYDGGVVQFDLGAMGQLNKGDPVKVAAAWAVNDIAVISNGGGGLKTDATATLGTPTTLRFGGLINVVGAQHIKRMKAIPRRASNAELQAFST